MGYIEYKLEKAGWGLMGGMFKLLLWAIPVLIVFLILGWPFLIVWKYGGHAWYWLTLATVGEVLWLALPILGLASRGRKGGAPVTSTSHVASTPAISSEAPLTTPARITQSWIEETVPSLSSAQVGDLMSTLRSRGWTDGEIAARVIPYCNI